MDKIRRALQRDRRKAAQVHEKSAVTVDGDDLSVGQSRANPAAMERLDPTSVF
jgi:hypothetical protein